MLIFYISSNNINKNTNGKLQNYYNRKYVDNNNDNQVKSQIIPSLPIEQMESEVRDKNIKIPDAPLDKPNIIKNGIVDTNKNIKNSISKNSISPNAPTVIPTKKQLFRVHDVKHIYSTSFILDKTYLNNDALNKLNKLKILVYKERFEENNIKANNGGPAGELFMFKNSLSALDLDVAFTKNPQELKAQLDLDIAFDFVFIDQYCLPDLRFHFANNKCRYRLLDFWGTPPEQNGDNLNQLQFLVPYANPWNYEFGLIIKPNPPTAGELEIKKSKLKLAPNPVIKVLIHGKRGTYLSSKAHILKLLLDYGFEVHTTVSPTQMEGWNVPTGVTNHFVTHTEYEELLRTSHVVFGLGDPVLAPTGLQAIASGTPYVFPSYRLPKVLGDLPQHPITSQHPYLSKLGAPYAYEVDLERTDNLKDKLIEIVNTPREPFIPKPYTEELHAKNLVDHLLNNYC